MRKIIFVVIVVLNPLFLNSDCLAFSLNQPEDKIFDIKMKFKDIIENKHRFDTLKFHEDHYDKEDYIGGQGVHVFLDSGKIRLIEFYEWTHSGDGHLFDHFYYYEGNLFFVYSGYEYFWDPDINQTRNRYYFYKNKIIKGLHLYDKKNYNIPKSDSGFKSLEKEVWEKQKKVFEYLRRKGVKELKTLNY